MTNVPPIPPLLCSTPPPIDFGDEEDSGLPPTLALDDDDDEFGDFTLNTNMKNDIDDDVPSLPRTPLQHELSPSPTHASGYADLPPAACCFIESNLPPPLESGLDKKVNLSPQRKPIVEAINPNVTLNAMPQKGNSIDLDNNTAAEEKSKKQEDSNAPNDAFNMLQPDDKTISLDSNDNIETNDDSNSSLPSLKLDSLSLNSGKQSATSTPPPSLSCVSEDIINSEQQFSDNDISDDIIEDVTAAKDNFNKLEENKENETTTEFSKAQTATTKDNNTLASNVEKSNSAENSEVIFLEDIPDDSSDDESHSPKKHKNFVIDENSADFFAIHSIAKEQQEDSKATKEDYVTKSTNIASVESKSEEKTKENDDFDDDFDDFTCFDATTTSTKTNTASNNVITTPPTQSMSLQNDGIAFDADFSQFADFSSSPIEKTTTYPQQENVAQQHEDKISIPENNKSESTNEDDEFDDDFDDFQDFNVIPTTPAQTLTTNKMATQQCEINETSNSNPSTTAVLENKASIEDQDAEDDDDDDFGDFSEALSVPTTSTTAPLTPVTQTITNTAPAVEATKALNVNNINERLKPMLDMMFPTVEGGDNINASENAIPNVAKLAATHNCDTLKLESIDTAKALDYQWLNSEVRHSLIKSLGIDSRNILFGDKWNASMPRFAANLSFDPLKPMKPIQSTSHTITDDIATSSSDQQMTSNSADATTANKPINSLKTENVPPVDFDWNSSSLVNPLDGSKEDAHNREIETLHTTQSGKSVASNDIDDDSNKQQQSLKKQQIHVANDDNATYEIGASGYVDPTAKTPTNVGATAKTTLSSIIPTDSNAGNIHQNFNNFDLSQPHEELSVPLNTTMPTEMNADIAATYNNNNTGCAAAIMRPVFHSSGGIDLGILEIMEDEVVTTSTYAGPLKETHIYTPSKVVGGGGANSSVTTAPPAENVVPKTTKVEPIDFDYEIAAAGIIIDETVVKKEYRDVEYNPNFSLEEQQRTSNGSPSTTLELKEDIIKTLSPSLTTLDIASNFAIDIIPPPKPTLQIPPVIAQQATKQSSREGSFISNDDDFCEFQSVPPPPPPAQQSQSVPMRSYTPTIVAKTKSMDTANSSRTSTPTFADAMILSPAILLPQAISMESNKKTTSTKIEWGDSAAINPEELARIEELFPQPKINKTKDQNGGVSQKSTPQHNNGLPLQNSLSISATIAQKELQLHNANNDDDDWSDFVSVPVAAKATTARTPNNNTLQYSQQQQQQQKRMPIHIASPQHAAKQHPPTQQRQQQQPKHLHVKPQNNAPNMQQTNNSNDDEWSDFVSSEPVAAQTTGMSSLSHFQSMPPPQFNSAAWQNANFYNNPLSLYHQNHNNVVPKTVTSAQAPTHKLQNNNNNNYNNNNINQYLSNYHGQQKQQLQATAPPPPQQIHIMQDFSTAAPSYYRPVARATTTTTPTSNSTTQQQHQVGSAKIAPSISLIPDLGFVAPSVPQHTVLVNTRLPKPMFNSKK